MAQCGGHVQKIIMVKKLLENGEPCRKCARAEEMLRARDAWRRIDEVLVFCESEPDSEGARLALRHGVSVAPFFIVRDADGERVYESTLELLRTLGTGARRVEPPRLEADLPSAEAVAALADTFDARSPEEILSWAFSRYGSSLGLAFSGAEDVALIDMAQRLGQPATVFCLDTGRLHPETYRFIDRVRAHYGLEISVLSPSAAPLEAFVKKKGLFSFYADGHAQCCSVRKLEPLRRVLAPFRAWVTGQRRDQSPTRADVQVVEVDRASASEHGPRIKLNPLALWSSARVWQYIREHDVPYNELHDRGFVSIGCEPCTRSLRPGEHERAARWWWEAETQRECGLHARRT
jgi:phosphoadenosine phosphosulfate reductase